MEDPKDREHDAHNKGQEDAAEGKYELPNQILGGWLGSREEARENDAYRKGWRHTKDQEED